MNFYKRKKNKNWKFWNFHGEPGSESPICTHFTRLSEASPVPATTVTTRPPTLSSVQFRSVAQSCPTLCHPVDCSTPAFPVHHQLPELTQTPVHQVNDAIPPAHPLSSPSPPAFTLSQHQGFFQGISSSRQVAKVLEFQLQHQSFQ